MATDTSVNQNFKSIYGIFGGGGGIKYKARQAK